MHVAIAWYGMPYYGAKVVGECIKRFPQVRFTVISTQVGIPYEGLEGVVGQSIIWLDDYAHTRWLDLGIDPPDICLLTSWSHPAYMELAREARTAKGAAVVSMTDNYFHGSLKQWLGALYFRLVLRNLFDFMWVPGIRSVRFMNFLGMKPDRIKTGLYAADPQLFYPSKPSSSRKGVIFVGQFIPRKGVAEIVNAVRSMEGQKFSKELRFFGHGPLEEALRQSGIFTEGFKQPAELGNLYRDSSALLLPSHMDHWGVVAHEAALCGLLILATRQCGCVDDLVIHKNNGYILNSCIPSEICDALNWLYSLTPEQIATGRTVSLQKAVNFSPKLWGDKLKEIMDFAENS